MLSVCFKNCLNLTRGSRKVHPSNYEHNHVCTTELWENPTRAKVKKKKACYSMTSYISLDCGVEQQKYCALLYWAFPCCRICSESVRPDSAICSLLKVMFRRLKPPVLCQFKNLQALLTLFCHVLKSTRGKTGINEIPNEIT